MTFAPDLAENIASGDANYSALLDEADAYVARNGLDLPEEPEARVIAPDPDCVTDPILALDLAEAGIATIIWATGFTTDYDWLKVDTFDEKGRPEAPARRLGGARDLFPGLALAVAPGIQLHLGRLARRQVSSQTRSRSNVTTSRITKRQHADERETSCRPLFDAMNDPTEAQMAHKRIRKFNTKDTYPEQNLDNDSGPGGGDARGQDRVVARTVPAEPRRC